MNLNSITPHDFKAARTTVMMLIFFHVIFGMSLFWFHFVMGILYDVFTQIMIGIPFVGAIIYEHGPGLKWILINSFVFFLFGYFICFLVLITTRKHHPEGNLSLAMGIGAMGYLIYGLFFFEESVVAWMRLVGYGACCYVFLVLLDWRNQKQPTPVVPSTPTPPPSPPPPPPG